MAAALFLLGACGGDDKKDDPAVAATTTSTTAEGLEGPQAYVDSGNYITGLHIGFIKAIDKAGRKIEFDAAEFLTGEQAVKAYQEDTGETDMPPNDYWLRNEDKTARDFVLADNAEFRVNNLGGFAPSAPDKGTVVDFDTFAGYFSNNADLATQTLFWISLEDGPITHVEEQFTP